MRGVQISLYTSGDGRFGDGCGTKDFLLPLTQLGEGKLGGKGVYSAEMTYREKSLKMCGKVR